MKDARKAIQNLEELLTAGVSPYHAVKHSIDRLEKAGFTELKPGKAWEVKAGNSYYVNLYGSSLIAFSVGASVEEGKSAPKIRIAASHTDWPCLRVKPTPEMNQGGYGLLNVECYGGLLLQTWLDRPLSMAGRVCIRGKDASIPKKGWLTLSVPFLWFPIWQTISSAKMRKTQSPISRPTCFPS